jgi:hypothetical protein
MQNFFSEVAHTVLWQIEGLTLSPKTFLVQLLRFALNDL